MNNAFNVQRFWGLFVHYFYGLKRNPIRFIEIVIWPSLEIVLFILLSLSLRKINNANISIVMGILTGVISWNFFARIIQEAVSQVTEDAITKNMQNILITPVSLLELVSSLLIVTYIKMMISFGSVLLILKFIFPDVLVSTGAFALHVSLLLVFWGTAVSLLALGFILLYGERMSFIGSLLSAVIQVFSCVFYSRTVLPGWLREISYLVPSSYIFEALRSFFDTGIMNFQSLGIAAVMIGMYFVLFSFMFQLSYKYAQRTGSLLKL